ncbi:MAG: hypothetical protein AAF711_09495 [Planctomycetota bacterium]
MNGKTIKLLLPILAITALVIGGYQAWLRTPPPIPETVEDVEGLIESPRYTRLTKAQKRPYQERMNEMGGGLSEEDRKRLWAALKENPDAKMRAGEFKMRDQFKAFAEMDVDARNAMLDMFINMMETPAAKQKMQEEMAKRNTPEGKEKEKENKKNMYDWLDKGDPQTMGYGSEFFKMMQQRREDRGLPPL